MDDGRKRVTSTQITFPVSPNESEEVTRSIRDFRPAHYTMKIQSFSLISQLFAESEEKKYESDIFESGGYKWRLAFYPNGRTEWNGQGHLSLYLVIAETDSLPPGWEVYVSFRLFVQDQIRDKYLTVEDDNRVKHFHAMKTEWGFAKFLPLCDFENAANGYLIGDSCIFGAEVFVLKHTGQGECVSILALRDQFTNIYTWKIHHFSTLNEKSYSSDKFTVGDYLWKLKLNPQGLAKRNGKRYIQLTLSVDDWHINSLGGKVRANYTLRIKDQIHKSHDEISDSDWFSSGQGYTFSQFMSHDVLIDKSKGFVVDDTLIIEAEVEIISIVKKLDFNLDWSLLL